MSANSQTLQEYRARVPLKKKLAERGRPKRSYVNKTALLVKKELLNNNNQANILLIHCLRPIIKSAKDQEPHAPFAFAFAFVPLPS